MLDDGWRQRLKRVLDELNRGHEEMMNVEVPAGAEETHRAVVRVAEKAMESNELLWRGVLDVDAETLKRSLERLQEASRLLEELVTTIERFCE
ncbi:MAG: hypothetical protein OXG46_06005 [Chloroflexi bacterium]|nr:hypothetical protein [Chloroflexota bacterium]MCY3937896.1 hypothetical protein [Chloroflexota bacterium]